MIAHGFELFTGLVLAFAAGSVTIRPGWRTLRRVRDWLAWLVMLALTALGLYAVYDAFVYFLL